MTFQVVKLTGNKSWQARVSGSFILPDSDSESQLVKSAVTAIVCGVDCVRAYCVTGSRTV